MKTSKYHIIYSWILLICFVTGQYMVYAHQHNITKAIVKAHRTSKGVQQQTIKEKCALCDVMHHNVMVKATQVYFHPAIISGHVYKNFQYSFTTILLILSGDRGPPSSCYNS